MKKGDGRTERGIDQNWQPLAANGIPAATAGESHGKSRNGFRKASKAVVWGQKFGFRSDAIQDGGWDRRA